MPITFGSVGDILAVAGLVKDLITTLNDSRGSAAEYRQIVQSLQNLHMLLLNLDDLAKLCNDRGNSVAESFTARLQAEQCRQYVASFSDKIKKYNHSLREGGSRNAFRDAYWKLHYRITHKECVEEFRHEVQLQIGLITALICAET